MKTTRFLAMWDNTGLECLLNISKLQQEHEQWEKDTMWKTLRGDPLRNIKPPGVPLDAMMMRARFNSHRHYEIYLFDSEISESDIKDMFETSPQVIVDSIRNIGKKLFCNRATKKEVIV